MEVYRVRGGGHTMPGGRPRAGTEALVGKSSGDFDGSEVICAFFRSCPPRKQPGEVR